MDFFSLNITVGGQCGVAVLEPHRGSKCWVVNQGLHNIYIGMNAYKPLFIMFIWRRTVAVHLLPNSRSAFIAIASQGKMNWIFLSPFLLQYTYVQSMDFKNRLYANFSRQIHWIWINKWLCRCFTICIKNNRIMEKDLSNWQNGILDNSALKLSPYYLLIIINAALCTLRK